MYITYTDNENVSYTISLLRVKVKEVQKPAHEYLILLELQDRTKLVITSSTDRFQKELLHLIEEKQLIELWEMLMDFQQENLLVEGFNEKGELMWQWEAGEFYKE